MTVLYISPSPPWPSSYIIRRLLPVSQPLHDGRYPFRTRVSPIRSISEEASPLGHLLRQLVKHPSPPCPISTSSNSNIHLYSRLKKVKCIQHTPNDKCEACTNAQIACRFRDRERYFAERSRIMAGSGSDSGRRSALSSRASSSSAGWNSSSNGTPSPDRDVAPPIVPSNATVRTTAFAQPIRDDYSMSRAYPQLSWSEYPQCTPMTNPYTSQAPNTLNGTHWYVRLVSYHAYSH